MSEKQYPAEVLEAVSVVLEFLAVPTGGAIFLIPGGVSIPLSLVDAAAERRRDGLNPAQLMEIWNTQKHKNLRACKILTSSRRRHCSARIKKFPLRKMWEAYLRAVNANAWAVGAQPSASHPNWKATFDWFIREDNVAKFIEGGFKQQYSRPLSARDQYGEDLERRSGDAAAPVVEDAEVDEDRPNG